VLTKPIGQVVTSDPAGGEVQHEALLLIYRGIDLAAVEDQEGLHRGVPHAFVAIDERVALDQREAKCGGPLHQRRVQVNAAEGGRGLCYGGLEGAEIAEAGGAAGCLEEDPVQLDDLPQREIPYQARRRYNSSFFRRTRSAAALNSSSRVASRSATAARARSSGARPRRSASRRSRSAWAGVRSMVSFMRPLYRVEAWCNKYARLFLTDAIVKPSGRPIVERGVLVVS
jgi:hypothetical protein